MRKKQNIPATGVVGRVRVSRPVPFAGGGVVGGRCMWCRRLCGVQGLAAITLFVCARFSCGDLDVVAYAGYSAWFALLV